MDKNAIKKYAVWARRELISRVSQKALQYGISDAGFGDKNADSVNGILLTADQKKQRKALIEKIEQYGADKKAYEQGIEHCHARALGGGADAAGHTDNDKQRHRKRRDTG